MSAASIIKTTANDQFAKLLPPLVGQYIGLVKDTALAAAIGYFELVREGQAIIARAGEWVQYSSPSAEGAEYIAVCLPAFSPQNVHRDA